MRGEKFMEENNRRVIAILLLGCFAVSLTATSATAKIYKCYMGQDNVDDELVIKKYEGCLAYLGYLEPKYVDGYFDKETVKAVKQFQRDQGITPISGKIGIRTHKTLKDACPARVWYLNRATYNEVKEELKDLSEIGANIASIVSIASLTPK